MRIFKAAHFAKWAKKNQVGDHLLKIATQEIENNLFDANLGGYVIKKRIATKGRGKSGSVRTIVAFRKDKCCFFIYGFEKNEKSNITLNEKKAFKLAAKELLGLSESMLDKYLTANKLWEVDYE